MAQQVVPAAGRVPVALVVDSAVAHPAALVAILVEVSAAGPAAAVLPAGLIAAPVALRVEAQQGVPAAWRVVAATLVVDSAAGPAAVRQAVLVAAPVAPQVAAQPGVPAVARAPAILVVDSAAALVAMVAEVLGALQPVLAAHPAPAQVEGLPKAVRAAAALADQVAVPTEVPEEVLAAAQAVAAGQSQRALRVAFRATPRRRIPVRLRDPFREATATGNPPLAPRQKKHLQASRDLTAIRHCAAEFIRWEFHFLYFWPVSC
jgi:hypothetical protein